MGDESQEAKVAVAVNDIEWLKESQRSTNRGIEQLQDTLSQYMKEQNERAEKFATKQELTEAKVEIHKEIEDLKGDLKSLQAWRWKMAGGAALAVIGLGILESFLRLKG